MTNVTTPEAPAGGTPPGVCLPFETKLRELGGLTGDEGLVRAGWESLDSAAYLYLWFWVHR